ncbi:uncharacterized protein RCO7_14730 [Rhynchosporium graminicola]|uniref:Uncharacterized protein n=1 Tax=Rhynchosporium graminicola TaxID=2792576 RepID=A0A1E1KZ41_9HELO|nr:uncharacterized protein RCO7_14730 [Rhynchosporium commune]
MRLLAFVLPSGSFAGSRYRRWGYGGVWSSCVSIANDEIFGNAQNLDVAFLSLIEKLDFKL